MILVLGCRLYTCTFFSDSFRDTVLPSSTSYESRIDIFLVVAVDAVVAVVGAGMRLSSFHAIRESREFSLIPPTC